MISWYITWLLLLSLEQKGNQMSNEWMRESDQFTNMKFWDWKKTALRTSTDSTRKKVKKEEMKRRRKERERKGKKISPQSVHIAVMFWGDTCSKAALKEAPVQRLLWHGSRMVGLSSEKSPLGLEADYPFNPKLYVKGKNCVLKLKFENKVDLSRSSLLNF